MSIEVYITNEEWWCYREKYIFNFL